ncbi:MAG: ferrous iron transporter B, partial [Firmicutes bacterium]|nr:ferrous iron transporter B [Bacillota bacterium]
MREGGGSVILALLGNPNSGKTTLFNALTGLKQHVGNFPGVTVERMEGALRADKTALLVDLPGIYSLSSASAEEAVSSGYLRDQPPDAIINIVDATCPERGLYLTTQLLALRVPMVVAMNMMDEVRKGGGSVDCAALSRGLGVPVLPVAASKGEGVAAVAAAALKAKPPQWSGLPGRGDGVEAMILRRYAFLEALCGKAVQGGEESAAQRRSRRVDEVLTHRVWAFPIFFGIMALVFFLTFGPVGGKLRDAFQWGMDAFAGGVDRALVWADAADWLRGLIVRGVLAGVGSVLSFLPTILTLFFLLSLLEDSGYMARMAFATDRLLRKVGLSGRSFVPALLGFGCSVPAILATRTLPTERDRRMTVMLVPFLSCSAKLPIYTMFSQAFFPGREVLALFALYAGGVLTGVPVALLLRKTAFPGNAAPFVLELPAYRMPTAQSALRLVRVRTAAFLRCAMTTLLLASIAVWALQRVDGSFQPVADNADSLMAAMGRRVAPLFLPLGFGDWRAATALLTGLMA